MYVCMCVCVCAEKNKFCITIFILLNTYRLLLHLIQQQPPDLLVPPAPPFFVGVAVSWLFLVCSGFLYSPGLLDILLSIV
jgi:hypothetical protein